jgi:hypothetical protein
VPGPAPGCSICCNPSPSPALRAGKEYNMLYTIAVILIILWLLGFVGFPVIGNFIHILLVIAVVMILVNLINGRRAIL